MDDAQCNFHEPTSADILIGKGGYGSIYKIVGKGCVVKVSHTSLPCREIRHEYDMTKMLEAALSTSLTAAEKRFIGIIRPSRFGSCRGRCCFMMQHLLPLAAQDQFVTQAYLAVPKHSKTISNRNQVRGIYRGAAELSNVLRPYAMNVIGIAYHVGVAVGAMHYGARLSGIDTEIVIAFSKVRSTHPKIFIIDHDRNGHLDLSKHQKTISLLSSLLGSGEPYYPLNGRLGAAFQAGYLKKARNLGFEKLAVDVLQMAMLESAASPPLPL